MSDTIINAPGKAEAGAAPNGGAAALPDNSDG